MLMHHHMHNAHVYTYIRDGSDFRFFPLLELPKFKINKNKFACSSEVPIFGLQSTQICNKNFFLPFYFRFFLGSTVAIPDLHTYLYTYYYI
jgi:hypothetical protein